MRFSISVGATCLIVATGHAAMAQNSTAYKCMVKQAYAVDQGKAVPHQLLDNYVNKEFVVDRTDGRMLGNIFSSLVWKTTQVLDTGSKEQSFKVIYISVPFVHVRLLVVREFDDGSVKNFTMMENDDVLTGTCTHLN